MAIFPLSITLSFHGLVATARAPYWQTSGPDRAGSSCAGTRLSQQVAGAGWTPPVPSEKTPNNKRTRGHQFLNNKQTLLNNKPNHSQK